MQNGPVKQLGIIAVGILAGGIFSCTKASKPASEVVAPTPYLREHRLPSGPRTGWLERVLVCPGGLDLVAKLDTGAKTSSIHATEYTLFTRNGQPWVRFSGTDRDENPYTFEREVVRMVPIKNLDGTVRERPAVKLGIVLANTYCEAEVNLEDRSHRNYRILLGRAYLQQAGLMINPAVTFRTKPNPELVVPAP